jgi:hypothetical protein
MKDWRASRSDLNIMYQGSLLSLGVQYPDAAQTQVDDTAYGKFLDSVYTLASAMPDARSRGQVLVSGWYAIKPETDDNGNTDWDSFYSKRDEFRTNLLPEDKTLLDSELKQRMTPVERVYFDFTQNQKFNDYWKLPEGGSREAFRVVNPELDASLNLWGYTTTLKTEKALDSLMKQAQSIGMDYNNLPIFQKKQLQQSSGLSKSSGLKASSSWGK